jgi:hypothetical protein
LGCRAAWAEMLSAPCNVRHAYLVRCLFGKTRRRHPCAPNAGMRCGLPASSRQCGRCLGWSSTCAEAADTSEPPNASPIPHHRSGFDRRAAYDIPRSVPALANANDPNMDDQPKTRLICRRCAARMKLARQLPWLDHRLPAVLLFQCIDSGMSSWSSGPTRRANNRGWSLGENMGRYCHLDNSPMLSVDRGGRPTPLRCLQPVAGHRSGAEGKKKQRGVFRELANGPNLRMGRRLHQAYEPRH